MNRKTKMFLATGLYIGVIGYFGGCEAWCLLLGGKLNEFGDFLAGVFTPVAFLWLIYGYLLQHEELEETRKTLPLSRTNWDKHRPSFYPPKHWRTRTQLDSRGRGDSAPVYSTIIRHCRGMPASHLFPS